VPADVAARVRCEQASTSTTSSTRMFAAAAAARAAAACPRTCCSPGPGAGSAVLDQKLLSHVTLKPPVGDGGTAGQLAAVNRSTWPGGPC